MLNKICLLVLLHMLILVSPIFAEGITIIVAPEARVEGAFITLGQLAEVRGDDVPWVNSLCQLKLGSTPAPGSSIIMTKDLLRMRLAATGSNFRGIVWDIPDNVKVTTSSQSVGGQTLIAKGIAAIQDQAGLGVNTGDLSITAIGSVQDVIIPMGPIVVTSNLIYGIHYNRPTIVQVVITVNGQVFARKNLTFDAKLYQQVAVVKSQINPGEILTADNLRYERMDSGHLALGYFTDINKAQGLMIKKALSPGMVVTESMLDKPLLMKRGNIVNVVARIGSMEVTTAGLAMQDGSVGQLIRIQNVNSKKNISATVLDASTVQVLTYKSNGV